MVERRKRRRFTAEFKAEAVRRLLEGGKGLSEVATELGLSPGQLSGWRDVDLPPESGGWDQNVTPPRAGRTGPRGTGAG
jgi:transposase-like protein